MGAKPRGPKTWWTQNMAGAKPRWRKNLWAQNLVSTKYNGAKNFLAQKHYGPKISFAWNIMVQSHVGTKRHGTKTWWTQSLNGSIHQGHKIPKQLGSFLALDPPILHLSRTVWKKVGPCKPKTNWCDHCLIDIINHKPGTSDLEHGPWCCWPICLSFILMM